MPELEIRDKHGVKLKEGDYIIGYRGWCKTMYKRKDWPDKTSLVLKIVWDKYRAMYTTEEIGILRKDAECHYLGDYRRILYELWVGYKQREDMICEDIEKVNLEDIDYMARKEYMDTYRYGL